MNRTSRPFQWLRRSRDAAAGALALAAAIPSLRAQSDDQIIYDDDRRNGWEDWGWASHDYASTVSPRSGSKAIRVTPGGYEALYLSHPAFDSSPYQSLVFWMRRGSSGTFIIQAVVGGAPQPLVALTGLTANVWTQVSLPLTALGAANKPDFTGFWIQNNSSSAAATFYLDDIRLVAVTPPAIVHVSVNAGQVGRTIDGRIFGLNLAMWDGQLASAASRDLMATIDTQSVRFPGGSLSDDFDWSVDRQISTGGPFQWASGPRVFAKVAGERAATAYATVNYGSGTPEMAAAWVAWANGLPGNAQAIGTDAKGQNWLTVGHWAGLRAAAPLGADDGFNHLRVTHAAPYGWRYWEVGNECYGDWEYDQHGAALPGAAHDAATYADAFKNFRQAMLAVDPTIKIGAVTLPGQDSEPGPLAVPNPAEGGATHNGWTPGVLATLKSLGALPDFIILHFYAQNPGGESDAGLLASPARLVADIADLRAQLNGYVGMPQSAGIEIAVTELNSVSSNPGKQSVSLVNGLFAADALATLAGSEAAACHWWDLRNATSTQGNMSATLYGFRLYGDYGLVADGGAPGPALNQPYPAFRAAKLLTHWARGGDSVVGANSDFPLLSVHAARRSDGRLTLLVINRSAVSELAAQVVFAGFTAAAGDALAWTFGMPEDAGGLDLGASAASVSPQGFTRAFPAYSMTVVSVPPAPTFESWRQSRFSAAELADPSISGESADIDRDGWPTLIEYAFGLDPKKADGSSLPASGIATVGMNHYLSLTLPRPRSITDLDYTVRVSNDMVTWTSGQGQVERVDDASTDVAVYRDATPIEAAGRRFIQVKVTRR